MFCCCSKLEYINLENAIMNAAYYSSVFSSTNNNLIVCSKHKKWNDLLNGIENIKCQNLYNSFQENQFKCYQKNTINIASKDKNICQRCGPNYYKIYNDTKNNNTYIYCYKELDGYYLDRNELVYKECYLTCKKCDEEGNEYFHNCLECNNNFTIETLLDNNKLNCYNICSNYFYYDNIMKRTFCTLEQKCPKNYSKLIIDKGICIDNCYKDSEYKYNYKGICYEKCPNNTINNSYNCDIISNEKNQINYGDLSHNGNIINDDISEFELIKNKLLTNPSINENIEHKLENKLIILTTTDNQKNNSNKNKSTINLKDCEIKLKKHYKIPLNNYLYIFKVDIDLEGINIPKIEYEVYYPLFNSDLIKLDLSICKDSQIDVSIPININGNIEKYNLSSNYYIDICSKTTSEMGTDISLSDRKNIFLDNNMTLCEEDCKLIDYNYTTKKAKCSCLIKIDFPVVEDVKFDKKKLIDNFINIKKSSNIKLIKCFNNVFNKNELLKNYGFFIYIFIYLFFFICFFLFYCKYYLSLKNEIEKIVETKCIKLKNNIDNIEASNISNEENKNNENLEKMKNNIQKNNYADKKKIKIKIKLKKSRKIIFPDDFKSNSKRKFIKQILMKEIAGSRSMNKIIPYKNKKSINENIDTINEQADKNILDYSDNELNSLIYEKAIKYDKRTFVQYYLSLIKTKHLLIFTFYWNNNDYNSQIIKIFLFIFFFAVHFTVNALFFNDETMHKIYIDNGKYDFIYQLPQIIYSDIISGVIETVIQYLALSESLILEIKDSKTIEELKIKNKENLRILKIKFILFFIISFILLFLFMFYITCFCGIYENTQLHLIKDSIISFGLSLIYPFGLNLIPGICRIPSLRAQKKDQEYLYKISQIAQSI